MNIVYAGSPEASKTTLEILYNSQKELDFKIVAVLSNPPSAKGRHKELINTPVANFALQKGIPVFTPEHLDSEIREKIAALKPDLLICFAYGHIFGPKFLSIFTYGGINLHPSELPKYRGCTPVQATILNDEPFLFISIQKISLKMDEGDIVKTDYYLLNKDETCVELLDLASKKGAELIKQIIQEVNRFHVINGTPQEGTASYTNVVTKQDAKIDWNNDSVEYIERKIRAYYENPCCWCLENNQVLKIYEAQAITIEQINNDMIFLEMFNKIKKEFETSENGTVFVECMGSNGFFILVKANGGILKITKLQRQGKSILNYKDFLNGARNFVGTVLK